MADAFGNNRRKIISIKERKLVDPKWSPDGNYIYFLSDFSLQEEKEKQPAISDVKVITRRFYRVDGEGYQHDRWMHVYGADVNTHPTKVTQLTSGNFDVVTFDLSPDGSELAIVANTDKQADFQNNVDIYTLTLARR